MMTQRNQKLELTWIGKENRPVLHEGRRVAAPGLAE
jgi:hypothetical protein